MKKKFKTRKTLEFVIVVVVVTCNYDCVSLSHSPFIIRTSGVTYAFSFR